MRLMIPAVAAAMALAVPALAQLPPSGAPGAPGYAPAPGPEVNPQARACMRDHLASLHPQMAAQMQAWMQANPGAATATRQAQHRAIVRQVRAANRPAIVAARQACGLPTRGAPGVPPG